jgi:DNA replication protein DnaC
MKKESVRELAEVFPAPPMAVDVNRLRGRLEALGMTFAAEQLTNFMAQAVSASMGPAEFLSTILDAEWMHREDRRTSMSLKLSGLPTGKTLSTFDFSYQPSIERSKLELLATSAWVERRQSLLILGAPGVGKTHLATALGVRAVESGFSVLFRPLDELMFELRRDAETPPAFLRRRGYMKSALLIIDELGFQPFNRQEASLFFRLVNYRYQRGSICITSNKSIRDWPELFAGDEVLTTALLDRLLHQSEVLNVKGRSYRLRDLEQHLLERN